MKKVLVAVLLCASLLTVGCASVRWNSSFSETATPGNAKSMLEGAGATKVGSYTTFLGYALGYDTYAGLVSAELRKGKRQYHTVVNSYYIFQTIHGYIEVLE